MLEDTFTNSGEQIRQGRSHFVITGTIMQRIFGPVSHNKHLIVRSAFCTGKEQFHTRAALLLDKEI